MDTVTCHLCGQGVGKDYRLYRAEKIPVCNLCEIRWPNCSRCYIPAKGGAKEGLCADCYGTARWCEACGRMITGRWWSVQGFPTDFYCEECINHERCWVCHRPVGERYWTYDRTGIQCHRCEATSVKEPAEGERLLSEIMNFFSGNLELRFDGRPVLTLTSVEEIRGMVKSWYCENAIGCCAYSGRESHIYVPYGMPRVELGKILAHETGHAWLAEQLHRPPDQLMEGFCEWTGWKAARYLFKSSRVSAKTATRTDFYGEGFQRVLAWERRHGQAMVPKIILRRKE